MRAERDRLRRLLEENERENHSVLRDLCFVADHVRLRAFLSRNVGVQVRVVVIDVQDPVGKSGKAYLVNAFFLNSAHL